MAKNRKSTIEQSFLQHSPPDFFGDIRIKRRIVKIPGDQMKLLEREQSWAKFLSVSPKPFLNVPPEVLESLKICHGQLQTSQSDESTPSVGPKDNAINPAKQDNPRFSSQGAQSEPDADSDDGKIDRTSWAGSPEEHKHPPMAVQEVQRASSEDIQQQFITQPPPISSPRPTVPTPVQRNPLPFSLPSSQEQKEALEYEAPTAIDGSVSPPQKPAAQSFATPPSAQVIPCTLEQPEQFFIEPKVKDKHQRIYKPPPKLYRPENKGSNSAHPGRGGTELDHQGIPLTNSLSSTSTTGPSSSIIPSTLPVEAAGNGMPVWCANPVLSPNKKSRINHEGSGVLHSPRAQHHSPKCLSPSPRPRSSPPASPIPQIAPSAIAQPQSASQTPFLRYTMTYPNYNGSINDFVAACMYIQLQQRRIRTSLYDDFIRAWHEGYLPYIRDCDDSGPPVKALNAIEWYNSIDDDPLFTSRVITKQNLDSTLNYYPDELHSARSLLGLPMKQSSQESRSTPDAARLAKGYGSISQDHVMQDIDPSRETPSVLEPERVESAPRVVPQPATPKPPPLQEDSKGIPLHKSMSEADHRPAKSKGFTRSFSETTHHKRKAVNDLAGSVAKRISVNSLAGSDSESNTSMISEAPRNTAQNSAALYHMSQKKRYDDGHDDPIKRSKKFVKKPRQRDMESIASSAPVSNTPTSGQRQ